MSASFRRLGSSAVAWACITLAPGVGLAQSGTKPGVSPVAPPTLKAPVFDTATPAYPQKKAMEKSAATVVAEVEGRPITLGEVADAIRALPPAEQRRSYEDLYYTVLTRLVRVQALLVQAQRQGLDGDAEVKRRMKAAADGVLVAEYIRRENDRAVTEDALLARYNKDVAGKPGPDEIRLWGIQVPTEAEARAVIAELSGGADFSAVARKSSRDVTAAAGGDIGWVTRAALAPDVAGVAFATQPGRLVTTPIASASGWLVIKVEQRRQAPTPSFAAVRAQLAEAIARDNTPQLADKAQTGLTIREYGINGQELDPATGGPLEVKSGHIPDAD